jgi:U3 small nucleolar RNA-associated protein 19
MRLIKERIAHIPGAESTIWSTGFRDIFQAVVEARGGQDLQSEFVNKFMKEYDEVRYYTFTQMAYVPLHLLAGSYTDSLQ